MSVTVKGKAGCHYALERTLVLNPAAWVTTDMLTATAENQTVTLQDPSLFGSTQAFMRVVATHP